ncbi:DNA polymerase III alpha subunit, partial [Pelomonas saccharophila]
VFISLEDEHGDVQVICHRAIWEKYRQTMMGARLMGVKGRWQRADGVCNLIAGYLEDRTDMLGALKTKSRNFH